MTGSSRWFPPPERAGGKGANRWRGTPNSSGSRADDDGPKASVAVQSASFPHVTGESGQRVRKSGDPPSNRVVPRRPPSSLGRGRLEYFSGGDDGESVRGDLVQRRDRAVGGGPRARAGACAPLWE